MFASNLCALGSARKSKRGSADELFFITMALKYGFDYPANIRRIGLAHGIAFIAFIAAMLFILPSKGFGFMGWMRTFAASRVPFGTFLNHGLVRRRYEALWTTARSAA